MSNEYPEFKDKFAVTAFIDVLGWSSLTAGISLLVLRKIAQGRPLSDEEHGQVEDLRKNRRVALDLDVRIDAILSELEGLADPIDEIMGMSDGDRFLERRHITYLRFSDSIFAHSSSLQYMEVFVSELLKRALDRGILLRAGMSGGLIEHSDASRSGRRDPRTRSITIIGDGITTAVKAEGSEKGAGVHAWISPRLYELLHDGEDPIGQVGHESLELHWWTDFTKAWPAHRAGREFAAPIDAGWIDDTIRRLESASEFEWNRSNPDGQEKVDDTIALLQAAKAGPPFERLKMAKKLVWKRIEDRWNGPPPNGYTYRAKVPGGWLVSVWAGEKNHQPVGAGVTFLPDPDHLWDVPDAKNP